MNTHEEKISVVIPVFNEEGNVTPLFDEIRNVLKGLGKSFEIIFVDDGSKDETVKKLKELSPIKIVPFRRNCGQTAALSAGFQEASGNVVISMDGDRQNDPADIPNLLKKLDEGWDVVCGWRKNRKDTFSKKILSKLARKLRKLILNDDIHDSGCTLRAYRKEALEDLELYGEMHRFMPAILKNQGFAVTEIEVNHRPRTAGKTKYSYKRLPKGLVDVIHVWFWYNFSTKPLHLFGVTGLALGSAGSLLGVILIVARLFFGFSLTNRIWPLVAVFLVLAGAQFFFFGLLAEIMIRTYYTRERKPYVIKEVFETHNRGQRTEARV